MMQIIIEKTINTADFTVKAERNGRFLELTGCLKKYVRGHRIPEAIMGANFYNAQKTIGQLLVEPDSGHVVLKIQSVIGPAVRMRTITERLIAYMKEEMSQLNQWMIFLNQTERLEGKPWLPNKAGKFGFSVRDKFWLSCKVEEQLEAVLKMYNIPYIVDDETMGVCCEWYQAHQTQMYHITVQPADTTMNISTVLSTHVPDDEMSYYLETCMILNQEIWGRFYLDFSSGCVCYRMVAPYSDTVDHEWMAAQLAVAEEAIGIWKNWEEKRDDKWPEIG